MAKIHSIFKTPKGIEIPLIDLKGKPYMMVQSRLVWFRELYPNGIIKTQMIEKGGEGLDEYCIFRAEIYIPDKNGGSPSLVSTAHKRESKRDFPDYIEKCESSCCGRALGFMGVGTQFVGDELDEKTRLADSPVTVIDKSTTATSEMSTESTPVMAKSRASFRKNVTVASASGDDI